MRRINTAITACAALLLLAGPADAQPKQRTVYLNGIDLSGVQVPEAVFKSCTVEFDKQGNIHITAPGFEVKAKEIRDKRAARAKRAKPRKKQPAKLTKSYFLISRESKRGATQYRVTVYLNGKQVTTIRSNGEPAVIDVTRFMKAGDNQIELLARKNREATSRNATESAGDVLSIQIGEGEVVDGEAVVRRTVLTYKRTAAETAAFRDLFTFESR
jgi:hypothetical protein